jgi:hypothetical protein
MTLLKFGKDSHLGDLGEVERTRLRAETYLNELIIRIGRR